MYISFLFINLVLRVFKASVLSYYLISTHFELGMICCAGDLSTEAILNSSTRCNLKETNSIHQGKKSETINSVKLLSD